MERDIKRKIILFVVVIGLIAVAALSADFYVDWMWFKALDFQSVFTTVILSKILLRVVFVLAFFILFMLNLVITRKTLLNLVQNPGPNNVIRLQKPFWEKFLEGRGLILLFAAVSFFLAYIFSAVASQSWMTIQQYLHAVPFGANDPIFGQDIGFYVFKLPFYKLIYTSLMAGIIVSSIIVASIYVLTSPMAFYKNLLDEFTLPKVHLSVLIALFFALKAWGYRLDIYNLLYSTNDIFFGAGYTDIHARLPAYKVLMIVALICAAVIIINLFIRRLKWVGISIGLLIATSLVLGSLYPAMVQKFRVVPNQFVMEESYIANSIDYTLKAYGMNELIEKDFSMQNDLTEEDIKNNKETIKNVRLWDWQPLHKTYSQLQVMKQYYNFKDVDVDRYMIDGEYRQVMIGVREIVPANLPPQAQNWINQKLKYTHGYGTVISPVNEVSSEGLPVFFMKNIPPQSTVKGLTLTRPEIYFGEETNDYVIVNTNTNEFNYPAGEEIIETVYEGEKGVRLSSAFRRIMYALAFGDYKILLSNELTNESQVLYNRNIHERIRKVAPFLHYDYDPYPVVSNGKIFWIQDAYTVTDLYPYSEPVQGWGNYIRNSVKVVVDAYDGTVNFYVVDNKDPIIKSYQEIFPDLFQSYDQMPDDLRNHLRYPEDLFRIQANIYTTYHMKNTRIFYNKDDKWSIPEEIFGEKKETMKPYFVIMQLPGEEQPEFLLMLPFTAEKRPNMIAWMAARSDGEHYGELLVYKFPQQKLIYGPLQIESRIDQDGDISKELTLWSQRGSNIFRGNLLVLPINNSLLYVEPLYLQAEQSKMPELRRVIVVYGEQVVMECTLSEALSKIFGEGVSQPDRDHQIDDIEDSTNNTYPLLAQKAYQVFQEAQQRLKEGDWAGYGERIKRLEAILEQMKKGEFTDHELELDTTSQAQSNETNDIDVNDIDNEVNAGEAMVLPKEELRV